MADAHIIAVTCDTARLALSARVVPLARTLKGATAVAVTSNAVHVVCLAHVDAALPRWDVVKHDSTRAHVTNTLPAAQHIVVPERDVFCTHVRSNWTRTTAHAHVAWIVHVKA